MQNERWVADRALLRRLIQAHPEWTRDPNWPPGLVALQAG